MASKAAPAVATSKSHFGRSVVDTKTPIHFALGAFAGAWGVEPSIVALAAIAYEAGKDVVGDGQGALFARRQGQSYANQAADVISMMVGVYLGKYTMQWHRNRRPQTVVSFAGNGAAPVVGRQWP